MYKKDRQLFAELAQLMSYRTDDLFWCHLDHQWTGGISHGELVPRTRFETIFTDYAAYRQRCDLTLPEMAVFEDTGIAAVTAREKNVSIFMRASPFGSIAHAHADQLSVLVDRNGQTVLGPGGYYDRYGSAHHRNWTRQSAAHNTMTLGCGKGQKPDTCLASGAFTFAEDQENVVRILMDGSQAYDGLLNDVSRSIAFVRPRWLVIRDEVSTNRKDVEVITHFHTPHDVSVNRTGKITIQLEKGTACLQALHTRSAWPEVIKRFPDNAQPIHPERYPPPSHITFKHSLEDGRGEMLYLLDLFCEQPRPRIASAQLPGEMTVRIGTTILTLPPRYDALPTPM